MKNTKIISAFPGTGKTTALAMFPQLSIKDSDSSLFSWSSPGVRHPDFPNNYIEHIKSLIGEVDFILVSSHKQVRDALTEAGIDYFLVYPDKASREEYLQRYTDRGNDKKFIDMMDVNFEKFVDECKAQQDCAHVQLKPGMYLSELLQRHFLI